MQYLGRNNVFVLSSQAGTGTGEAILFIENDGTYQLKEGNNYINAENSPAVLNFNAMSQIAGKLSQDGYTLPGFMANMINGNAPQGDLAQNGAIYLYKSAQQTEQPDYMQTLTDLNTGAQYGYDLFSGIWFNKLSNGDYKIIAGQNLGNYQGDPNALYALDPITHRMVLQQ